MIQQKGSLGGERSEGVYRGIAAVGEGEFDLQIVGSAVEVVEGFVFENRKSEAAGFLGGAVVEAELFSTAVDIDPAFAERGFLAVDALVRIVEEECAKHRNEFIDSKVGGNGL